MNIIRPLLLWVALWGELALGCKTYSFQSFSVGQVLTAAQMDQVEANIRDHQHGVSGVSNTVTLGTAQATTSGTAISFTGIPAGVRRVTMNFIGVSIDATTELLVQLGDAGGIETSGYLSTAAAIVDASAVAAGQSTAGFVLTKGAATAGVFHGRVVLELENSAAFTWSNASTLSQSNAAAIQGGGGSKSLAAELTQVNLTTVSGTANFDAGEVNITYEL